MQEWLGWEKVSCLERCPQFRRVLKVNEILIELFVLYNLEMMKGVFSATFSNRIVPLVTVANSIIIVSDCRGIPRPTWLLPIPLSLQWLRTLSSHIRHLTSSY